MGAAACAHRQPAAGQGHQAAGRAAMIKFPDHFSYTEKQRDRIKGLIRELGINADVIPLGGGPTPLARIEVEAGVHLYRSAVEGERLGRTKRIRLLTKLRDTIKLRDDIIAGFISHRVGEHTRFPFPDVDFHLSYKMRHHCFASEIEIIEREIARLEATPPTANTSKAVRDQLWIEALAVWCDLGGKPTGVKATEFLVAVSQPVFRVIRKNSGNSKTSASMPQNYDAVERWLRLRASAERIRSPTGR